MIGGHRPDRPSWWCRGCGRPYPCPAGREQLVAEYGRTGQLGRVAYSMLEQAVADLPGLPVTVLWDRFVAWTEPVGIR